MPQNFTPPWDFAPVQIPLEWFVHTINILRMPQGLAGEDDAGGRTSASDPGAATLIANMPCLVIETNLDQGGPEAEDVRLVFKRKFVIWTPTDLTNIARRGDMAVFFGRKLSIDTVENVAEQYVIWKIVAQEYL